MPVPAEQPAPAAPPRVPAAWHSHDGGALHAHDGQEHGHEHGHEAAPLDARILWSVGVDVGSSTTHLTVSQLVVGRPNNVVHRKPEVLERRLVYRSPITFTPFVDDVTIDAAAIQRLVAAGYAAVGVEPSQIDTGAVICTGLAALKQNAAAITARIAADSGRFVCATAGHHFEAMLAARGSGSVALSRRVDGLVVNLDVGGGTTKLTLIRDGVILATAALAVGARLITFDAAGHVARVEPSAHPLLAAAGVAAEPGTPLAPAAQTRLAELMAASICAFAGLRTLPSSGRSDSVPTVDAPLLAALLLTDPPLTLVQPALAPGERQAQSSWGSPQDWGVGGADSPDWLVCSGGVSEFVYGWQNAPCGDLGQSLGIALRAAVDARLPAGRLVEPAEGIRATVIGACQYSVQVSGDTVFLSDPAVLPLHNVPVVPVPLEWEALSPHAAEESVVQALRRAAVEGPCALAFRGPSRFGYGQVDALARGLAAALADRAPDAALVLAFDQDLANTLGRALTAHLARPLPLICVDELTLGELDYLDLGEPPPGETYLPAVVKSLVFAG
jgi:ethanolamine utilization protein EutA